MERRAAPYPYSKMCELCELCELLERKIPPLPRWDLLYLSAAEFIRWPRSLQTTILLSQSRETSSASRRGLRGLETRLLWFAMRLLSYLSLAWYIKNKIDRLCFFKNNGLRPIIKIIHNYFSLSNKRKNRACSLFNLEKSCYLKEQRPSAYYFFLQPSGTREALLEQPQATGTTGTPHSGYSCTCVRW